MKVDNPRVDLSNPVQPAAADVARPPVRSTGPADSDAVRLSANLRLADEAVRAAALSGDVRPAAVAKARALLASGKLGNDLEHLADRIINHLTQSIDPN